MRNRGGGGAARVRLALDDSANCFRQRQAQVAHLNVYAGSTADYCRHNCSSILGYIIAGQCVCLAGRMRRSVQVVRQRMDAQRRDLESHGLSLSDAWAGIKSAVLWRLNKVDA